MVMIEPLNPRKQREELARSVPEELVRLYRSSCESSEAADPIRRGRTAQADARLDRDSQILRSAIQKAADEAVLSLLPGVQSNSTLTRALGDFEVRGALRGLANQGNRLSEYEPQYTPEEMIVLERAASARKAFNDGLAAFSEQYKYELDRLRVSAIELVIERAGNDAKRGI